MSRSWLVNCWIFFVSPVSNLTDVFEWNFPKIFPSIEFILNLEMSLTQMRWDVLLCLAPTNAQGKEKCSIELLLLKKKPLTRSLSQRRRQLRMVMNNKRSQAQKHTSCLSFSRRKKKGSPTVLVSRASSFFALTSDLPWISWRTELNYWLFSMEEILEHQ